MYIQEDLIHLIEINNKINYSHRLMDKKENMNMLTNTRKKKNLVPIF